MERPDNKSHPRIRRIGTTLMLGDHHAVRVLPMPRILTSRRSLNHLWDECFGNEVPSYDIEVSIPWEDYNEPLDN